MRKLPLMPSLITAFFVILMLILGFWQLNRAAEKQQLLLLLADDNVTKINQKEQIKKLAKYANIELEGHYLNQPQLLLDNQVNKQVVGYHVFTPFKINAIEQIIMVNRGWINKKNHTDEFIKVATKPTTITGKLNDAPQVGIQLGEIELDPESTSQLITYFDTDKIVTFLYASICQDLHCLVSSKIMWLKADNPQGFKRDWQPIIMPPSKHIGYAVQWFGMTIVLIIIFIYWLRKYDD